MKHFPLYFEENLLQQLNNTENHFSNAQRLSNVLFSLRQIYFRINKIAYKNLNWDIHPIQESFLYKASLTFDKSYLSAFRETPSRISPVIHAQTIQTMVWRPHQSTCLQIPPLRYLQAVRRCLRCLKWRVEWSRVFQLIYGLQLGCRVIEIAEQWNLWLWVFFL